MLLRVLWLGLKAVLSLALLSGAAWLMVKATPPIAEQPEALGISAVLLFMAALLWVRLDRPSRAGGLAVVVLSFGPAFAAARMTRAEVAWPRTCTRQRGFCELANLLHDLGGPYLAAAPSSMAALIVFFIGVRVVVRTSSRP